MPKRNGSLAESDYTDNSNDNKPYNPDRAKRLNHTFEDLISTSRFQEFEVLTSDDYWTEVQPQETINSEDRVLRLNLTDDDQQIDKSDSLQYVEQYKIATPFVDYHPLSKDRVLLTDFCTFDYPTCIMARQLLTKSKIPIVFSDFLGSLDACLSSGRIAQARAVLLAFSDSQPHSRLTSTEREQLLRFVIRASLEPRFDDILLDMAHICKATMSNEITDTIIRNSIDKDVFISCPYRAVAVGNFIRLFSFDYSRSFYDHLLNGGPISLYYEYLADELAKDCESRVKTTERLVLCFGRLTVTREKCRSTSELLSLIRKLKGRLPNCLLASVVDLHDILTKMSCFLIANDMKGVHNK